MCLSLSWAMMHFTVCTCQVSEASFFKCLDMCSEPFVFPLQIFLNQVCDPIPLASCSSRSLEKNTSASPILIKGCPKVLASASAAPNWSSQCLINTGHSLLYCYSVWVASGSPCHWCIYTFHGTPPSLVTQSLFTCWLPVPLCSLFDARLQKVTSQNQNTHISQGYKKISRAEAKPLEGDPVLLWVLLWPQHTHSPAPLPDGRTDLVPVTDKEQRGFSG